MARMKRDRVTFALVACGLGLISSSLSSCDKGKSSLASSPAPTSGPSAAELHSNNVSEVTSTTRDQEQATELEDETVAVKKVTDEPVDCTIGRQIEPRLADACSFIETVEIPNDKTVRVKVDVYVSEAFGSVSHRLHALVLNSSKLDSDGNIEECIACGGELSLIVAEKVEGGYRQLAKKAGFTFPGANGEGPDVRVIRLSPERLAILVSHVTFNGWPSVHFQDMFEITRSGVKPMLAKEFVTSCSNDCGDTGNPDCSEWSGELTIIPADKVGGQPVFNFKQEGKRWKHGPFSTSGKMRQNRNGLWESSLAKNCGDLGS